MCPGESNDEYEKFRKSVLEMDIYLIKLSIGVIIFLIFVFYALYLEVHTVSFGIMFAIILSSYSLGMIVGRMIERRNK